MFKNALVSVADKTGLIDFLKPLVENGLRIVSTGGTAKHLKEAGIPVVDVSEQTGFQEVMNGRVKTLHPNVHMCLLARDHVAEDLEVLKSHDLKPFDLVIGNLYPFADALKKGLSEREQVEFIDIGGPSLLRAAAKSFERITVVVNPSDYQWIADKNETTLQDRRLLASKVFSHVSTYDSMISSYLRQGADTVLPGVEHSEGGQFHQELRYGENPQQKAAWYKTPGALGLQDAEVLQGKALSYNNLLDVDAALTTLREFPKACAAISLKHNNPCGVAVGSDPLTVLNESLGADPVSVFGGIVAVNFAVDEPCAEALSKIFLECVLAPDFSPAALGLLSKKKNLRVLKWPDLMTVITGHKVRSITGGFLLQSDDTVASVWPKSWEIYGEAPSEEIKDDLLLAWKVCAHLKSNAIALAGEGKTLGLGMGQVNRIDAVEQAITRMRKFHSGAKRVVLASDAFFPFSDSIELAADAGIEWVVQPGGSIKDEEVKVRAKERGVNLILTGVRHFLH